MANASYQGLARKWRPQTFEDLAGQETVAESLRNSLSGNRVVHGHILAGPRGVGKTTSARILARALNCEKGPTPTPCGKCRHCLDITAGNDLDVKEIDAASNNGVDDVRELIENVVLSPFSARYKVYIIDEVHMLTTPAFNALLKTLEEPPPNVVFIFATTEFEKIPETVRSRCAVHPFRRLSAEDIVRRLAHVAGAEGIKLEEGAAREIFALIAQSAEGGMRDALMALDQLLAMTGGKPDVESAQRLLGMAGHALLADCVGWLAEGNPQKLLRLIEDLVNRGRSLERFVKGLLAYVHDVMLLQAGAEENLISLTGDGLTRARELARKLSQPAVFNMLNQLFELEEQMKRSTQIRFLIEFAFLRMAAIKPVVPINDLINRLKALPEAVPAVGASARPEAVAESPRAYATGAQPVAAKPVWQGSASASPALAFADSEPALAEEVPPMQSPGGRQSEATIIPVVPSASTSGSRPLAGLAREELIEMIVPQMPEAAQFLSRYLRVSTAMRADGNALWIQWPKDERTASRMIAQAENKRALEQTLAQICGVPMMVKWNFAAEEETVSSAPRLIHPQPMPVFSESEPEPDWNNLTGETPGKNGSAPNPAQRGFSGEASSPSAPIIETSEALRALFDGNAELARRAKMVRDLFKGTFVDAAGRPLAP